MLTINTLFFDYGDYNRNGITDNGEDTLFYTTQEALTLLNSSIFGVQNLDSQANSLHNLPDTYNNGNLAGCPEHRN